QNGLARDEVPARMAMLAQVPSACRGHAARDVENRESEAEDLPSLLRCPTNSLSRMLSGALGSALLLENHWSWSSRAVLSPRHEKPLALGTLRGSSGAWRLRWQDRRRPMRNVPSVTASFVKKLARDWTGRLAHYASHRNDEHRLALFE